MVRLKATSPTGAAPAGEFQFHYGTIKSIQSMVDTVQGAIFQFHYGTIKRYGFFWSLA